MDQPKIMAQLQGPEDDPPILGGPVVGSIGFSPARAAHISIRKTETLKTGLFPARSARRESLDSEIRSAYHPPPPSPSSRPPAPQPRAPNLSAHD